tara:strand:- start:1592 stop:1954 length:363 start_codon:yes stop_codon:yes gene_type:complete
MTNKRLLRNIQSYLNRRKIEDKALWLRSSSINTMEDLRAFCAGNLLQMNEEDWNDFFVVESNDVLKPDTKEVKPPRESKTAVKDEDKKTWHTPAAKRPIKKSAPKRSSSSSKKSNVKDKQ